MNDTPNGKTIEEAADWLVRLNEAGGQDLRAQHDLWLRESEANQAAWTKVCAAWSVADAARPVTAAEWPEHIRDSGPSAVAGRVVELRPRKRRHLPYGAALVAACLLLAIVPQAWQSLEADYATTTAELRTVELADGSTVNLGADSSISVELTASTRTVRLLSGRAYFDVARDAGRPFVVRADDVAVSVLGTAFDVGMGHDAISVAVKRGLVGVRYENGKVHADEQVSPGNQLTINRQTGVVTSEAFPTSEVGSWTDGKLFVENAPISEVVEELRRYHHGFIVLQDDVGTERVTGFYNLRNPDQALAAMLLPVGGSVRNITPFITVISGRSDPSPK